MPGSQGEATTRDKQCIRLAKRHALGEAALQALVQTDLQLLEEEGIFDSIRFSVQRIGPVVLTKVSNWWSGPQVFKATKDVAIFVNEAAGRGVVPW